MTLVRPVDEDVPAIDAVGSNTAVEWKFTYIGTALVILMYSALAGMS